MITCLTVYYLVDLIFLHTWQTFLELAEIVSLDGS
jgi:hypothetical protein